MTTVWTLIQAAIERRLAAAADQAQHAAAAFPVRLQDLGGLA